ncbi:hypothetical protein [Aureimonas sp. AU40]|uniref:hypothetical protein n=1 Tax=Aureimonas sp. AU40 TaxID=1637747 RepID=UPI0007862A67|nr:hypothetical protein [Aureimonas sp. AU40]
MSEQQIITDIDDLKQAIREGVAYGAIDVRNTAETMREFYVVGDEITDEEIEAAHVAELRSEHAPVLLLTLGGTVHVRSDEITDEDGIADAARQISEIGGETIVLERVPDHQRREGDFVAVRMPKGTYEAHNHNHRIVERFGVEVGTYRQRSAADVAA